MCLLLCGSQFKPAHETRMSELSNEYRVGNSPAYALFSIILHGGAGLMLLLTGAQASTFVPASALIGLAWLTLGVAAIYDLRRTGVWRGHASIARISIADRDRSWWLCQRSGRWFGPALVTGGRVMGAVIWLRLCDESGHHRAICIPADAMSATMFRRLRVAAGKALGQ